MRSRSSHSATTKKPPETSWADSQTPTADEDEDELSKWVKLQGGGMFLPHDQLMIDQLPVVAQWANSQRYTPAAVSTFLGCADFYIVAFALAHK